MKKNPSVNRDTQYENINKIKIFGENFKCEGKFIRNGQVGEHKTVMTKEMIAKFDKWSSDELKNYEDLRNEYFQ